MTIQQARRLLDGFLGGMVSKLAFQHVASLEFVRRSADATALVSWPCRLDPRGFAAFTCNVGLRFEGLAGWLGDDPKEMAATVGTPVHLLRDNRSFTEWKFSDAGDLEGLRGAILGDLDRLVLPYIERYSTMPSLRGAVESADAQDWIKLGLDQDRRVNVLAAIQMAQGDKAGAVKTLEDALAERKAALPRRRIEIESLRRRLADAG